MAVDGSLAAAARDDAAPGAGEGEGEGAVGLGWGSTGVAASDQAYQNAIKAHEAEGMTQKLQAAWEVWFDSNNSVTLKRERVGRSLGALPGVVQSVAMGPGGSGGP